MNKHQPVVPEISSSCMTDIETTSNMAIAIQRYLFQNKGPIKEISLEINQVPSEQNGIRAVVTSTVTTSCGSYQGIGTAAKLEVDGEPDVQRTIDGATVQSLVRAFGTASLIETGKVFLASSSPTETIIIGRDGSFGRIELGTEEETR